MNFQSTMSLLRICTLKSSLGLFRILAEEHLSGFISSSNIKACIHWREMIYTDQKNRNKSSTNSWECLPISNLFSKAYSRVLTFFKSSSIKAKQISLLYLIKSVIKRQKSGRRRKMVSFNYLKKDENSTKLILNLLRKEIEWSSRAETKSMRSDINFTFTS